MKKNSDLAQKNNYSGMSANGLISINSISIY
jgi:hypothetical protein